MKDDIKDYFNFKEYGKVVIDIETTRIEEDTILKIVKIVRKKRREVIAYHSKKIQKVFKDE